MGKRVEGMQPKESGDCLKGCLSRTQTHKVTELQKYIITFIIMNYRLQITDYSRLLIICYDICPGISISILKIKYNINITVFLF